MVLRTAIAENRGALPHIRDIRHAIVLRKDSNLRSMREMLMEFNKAVQAGDTNAVVKASHEVERAKRAVTKAQKWQRRLDWVTYSAVPIGVAEAMTGLPPIAGISCGAIGATGVGVLSHVKRRHGWVMFNL